MRQYLRLIRLPMSRRRRAAARMLAKAFRDDSGGEVLEYALIGGLIVAGAVATIGCVGTKIAGRWTSIKNSL